MSSDDTLPSYEALGRGSADHIRAVNTHYDETLPAYEDNFRLAGYPTLRRDAPIEERTARSDQIDANFEAEAARRGNRLRAPLNLADIVASVSQASYNVTLGWTHGIPGDSGGYTSVGSRVDFCDDDRLLGRHDASGSGFGTTLYEYASPTDTEYTSHKVDVTHSLQFATPIIVGPQTTTVSIEDAARGLAGFGAALAAKNGPLDEIETLAVCDTLYTQFGDTLGAAFAPPEPRATAETRSKRCAELMRLWSPMINSLVRKPVSPDAPKATGISYVGGVLAATSD